MHELRAQVLVHGGLVRQLHEETTGTEIIKPV
jgi:hypothetical protein